jgi:hypothetical protein
MYDAYRLLESQNICLLCEFNGKTILALRVPRSISIVQAEARLKTHDRAAFSAPKNGTGGRGDVGLARKIRSSPDEFLVASDLKFVAHLLLKSNSKVDRCNAGGMALQIATLNPI